MECGAHFISSFNISNMSFLAAVKIGVSFISTSIFWSPVVLSPAMQVSILFHFSHTNLTALDCLHTLQKLTTQILSCFDALDNFVQ
jgi:hypothetical protein